MHTYIFLAFCQLVYFHPYIRCNKHIEDAMKSENKRSCNHNYKHKAGLEGGEARRAIHLWLPKQKVKKIGRGKSTALLFKPIYFPTGFINCETQIDTEKSSVNETIWNKLFLYSYIMVISFFEYHNDFSYFKLKVRLEISFPIWL